MADAPTLRTERLILRPWRDADREPFAKLNADPEVMMHLPAELSAKQSNAFIARINAHFDHHGFGLWAVEVPYVAPFVGFVGLWTTPFRAHFTPAVELGWRLARDYWGQGYATEGATAAVRYGFDEAGLSEVVCYAQPKHQRSARVMQKVGMTHDPVDDFQHPRLPLGHPMREQMLWRIDRAQWRAHVRRGRERVASTG